MIFKFSGENQVVARYKLAIVGVFIAIILTALSVSSYRYFTEIASFEQNELAKLVQHSNNIEAQLSKALQSLEAIQRFANYGLNFPEELAPTPKFKQDNDYFYLDKVEHDFIEHRQHISANITGIGQISSFDEALKQELAMANLLTPAFITAQNINPSANWFSYISAQHFISLYPWIGRKNWQYSDRLLHREYFKRVSLTSSYDKKPIWSEPYIGTSGQSLYIAIAAGVFRQKAFTGAAVININLAKLYSGLISDLNIESQEQSHYVLINTAEQLLVQFDEADDPINQTINWQEKLPHELRELSYEQLNDNVPSFVHSGWLIQHHRLEINDWMLVKYQPYDDFYAPISTRFIWLFFLLLIGQLTVLLAVYLVTRNTFIKPTQHFISHIAHSAKGDHGKILPPEGWQHWFNVVGDIFSQNRSLLQQLKDQNNILDRRVAEKTQALVEKSQQHQQDYAILRSVMDAIPDYLIFNNVDGEVIGCNLAFEKFANKKESEILGRKAGTFIRNELGQALLDAAEHAESIESQHGIFQVIETVDNTYELFVLDFYNQAHQVLGTIVIIRDVTEQYAINSALATAKEQAELANKAKSQFLANMSHEIRTPINAIQGMQSLLEQTALTNQQRQHLFNAQSASDALLHLVDELLDLAKIESGNMSIYQANCCLDSIVNQAVKLNIGSINHQAVKLNIAIAANVPTTIFSDEMRLVQVLSNLLNNAIKFTAQGEISLAVDVIAKSEEDSLIRFCVTDTGIGIAKEKQARLFEAFMQADESMTRLYGGSGLGLSICQRIVKLLGGEIKLTSDTNQGAEFSFVIPFKSVKQAFEFEQYSAVHTFSLSCQLPVNVIELFEQFNYTHQQLSELAEVKEKAQLGVNVLFLSIDEIYEQHCQFLATELACSTKDKDPKQQCVVAICQAVDIKEVNQAYDLLERFNIPYVICEEPMYRFGLMNILQSLSHQETFADISDEAPSPQLDDKLTKASDLFGINILLVEDNLVNQLVAKELLKAMKADVVLAENGQQALDVLAKETFDVVLMDIQMPVMDGLTATRLIREQTKFAHLPIIAMTAHARQEDKDNSFSAGMNMHIAKPVKAETLLKSILSLLKDHAKSK